MHLKHRSSSGHLIHGPHGHLSRRCSGCGCADLLNMCVYCPDATPSQFHVTFSGITLCTDCVNCDDGSSAKIDGGSSINGTYLMAKDGPCGWVTESDDIPCTLTVYSGADCSGTAVPLKLAIEQQRIDANTFLLQITDEGNSILVFSATVTTEKCCASYTVSNENTSCSCGDTIILGVGGSATVTPC
ncbi:MAG TPA: hypothetical protein VH370_17100 [Humisphaera sp.]|jgi:hypothetical protein|nr:hypothetical protein [Humisphaera sp.]